MMVAGVGCTKDTRAMVVLATLDTALDVHGFTRDDLALLATVPGKRDEAGLIEAAEILGIPLAVPTDQQLKAADTQGLTKSETSLAATGLGSASEAAALAACGPDARLLGPRLVQDGVTCALAVSGVD
ncbi:cobalamin biosynthesis protein [Tianweitania sp. BSSL-BM11]|uniref:Cobalamin biosynthesis protein n=1 Tax=Tianweitania aestuarii TaxID=2814886 RepID=A0ABS5RWC9_9HYPH|nr:cobalamin biosynthesis protein [Tianweitania aestuarii]MBS9720586.1 cobalamin biosynthesis protein [Tianweitania aestuarii]